MADRAGNGNPRRAAVEALLHVHRDGGYSHIVWENALETDHLTAADRALASRIFWGVIERRLTLDYLMDCYSRVPVKKLQPAVREILRTGLYQLLFMERIPASAAVNESVKLTRSMKVGQASGFVNAVLRAVSRQGMSRIEALPEGDEKTELLYSCPRELTAFWQRAYGVEQALALTQDINREPIAFFRVDLLHFTQEQWEDELNRLNIDHRWEDGLPGCLCVSRPQELRGLEPPFRQAYYAQDKASQWCCAALNVLPGEQVADVCAAPGGKSLTIAQSMHNEGLLISGDIHEHKCRILRQRLQEFGITISQVVCRDASAPCEDVWKGSFHRVLCDVPCSGLGVIGRKPEIRYRWREEVDSLPALQLKILEQGAEMVRPGGVLQYSTCTLNPAENEGVAERFLSAHPEYSPRLLPAALQPLCDVAEREPSHHVTLFPSVHDCDGFFIASFQKRN